MIRYVPTLHWLKMVELIPVSLESLCSFLRNQRKMGIDPNLHGVPESWEQQHPPKPMELFNERSIDPRLLAPSTPPSYTAPSFDPWISGVAFPVASVGLDVVDNAHNMRESFDNTEKFCYGGLYIA